MHMQSAIKKTRASNHRRGQSRTGNASKQQASNGRKQASGKQAGSMGRGYAGCATSGSFMPARSLVGACGWTAGSARGRCPRLAHDERQRSEPEVQFQFGCLWACGPRGGPGLLGSYPRVHKPTGGACAARDCVHHSSTLVSAFPRYPPYMYRRSPIHSVYHRPTSL